MRRRRIAFRISLAAFIAAAVLFVASGFVYFLYFRGLWEVHLGNAALQVTKYQPPTKVVSPSELQVSTSPSPRFLFDLPSIRFFPPSAYFVRFPIWILVLVTAIPTAWLWHRDRRRIRPGCCLRCGYDLTGNTSGVCSECGEKKAMANSE